MSMTLQTLDAVLRDSPLDMSADVEQMRPVFRKMLAAAPLAADVELTDMALGGVPALRIGTGASRPGGTVLGFHGGCYAFGDARSTAGLMADVARHSAVDVISVDYRLAPEHPFPAAPDDALAAYRGLLDSGVAASSVAIFGESAGAGLALATVLAARDAGLPQPACVVLLSPWADLTQSGASIQTHAHLDPALTQQALQTRADSYLDGADPRHPLASPLLADLAGLAPVLIQAGGHEVLLDDALRLAARAATGGLDVTLEVTAGAPHVFQAFAGHLPEAAASLDRVGAYIRRRLS